MKRFTLLIILIVSSILIVGCSKVSQENKESMIKYCSQFTTEETCDTKSCIWDVLVPCAIPGKNCGVAYTGDKGCLYKN